LREVMTFDLSVIPFRIEELFFSWLFVFFSKSTASCDSLVFMLQLWLNS